MGDYATPAEVRAEFEKRHEQNKQQAQAEQERKQALRQHHEGQSGPHHRSYFTFKNKVYRLVDDPSLTEAQRNDENVVLLGLKEFSEETNTKHGFFTTSAPDLIMG